MFSCRSGLRFESHSGKKKKNQHRLVLVLLLARPEGLEPPTFWFVARHSIQLSYERVCSVLFNSETYINTVKGKKQGENRII